ncbi:MAG TPA: hypothetical protein VGG84_05450 [Gemmatimonadaceae bacterium]
MPRVLTAAVRSCALVLLVVIATPVHAQTADSAAVLAVVSRLFDAMAQRDTVAARAVLAPGTQIVSIRGDTTGVGPRVSSDTAFIRSLGSGHGQLRERLWSPTVLLRGPLATVWAPYDFHLDGLRTHCGIDAFTLVRTGSVWRVTGIAYTVERRNCVDSPLGPPQ